MPIFGDIAIHQDRPLASVALAYKQSEDKFIAGRVFPEVPVQKSSDSYYVWDRDAFLRSQAAQRAPGSAPVHRWMSVSTDQYACKQYAVGDFITLEDVTNQDAAVQLRASTTEALMADMMIARDQHFMDAYMTTGIWGTDLQGVADGAGSNGGEPDATEFVQWDDTANSNPIRDIRDQCRAIMLKTGQMPNKLVIDAQTRDAFMEHPVFRAPSQGFASTDPTLAEIARRLNLDEVIVSEAVKVTSKPGAASITTDWLLSKKALLVHTPNSPGIRVPAAGMVFQWTGLLNGIGASQGGIVVRRLPKQDELREDIDAFMAYDMKLTGAELGCLFYDTVS